MQRGKIERRGGYSAGKSESGFKLLEGCTMRTSINKEPLLTLLACRYTHIYTVQMTWINLELYLGKLKFPV